MYLNQQCNNIPTWLNSYFGFCNGACDGFAQSTPSGGTPPYNFIWDDGSGQTTAQATLLCAGLFNVTVTDISGCSDNTSIVITEPQAMAAIITSNDATCFGDCDGNATVSKYRESLHL